MMTFAEFEADARSHGFDVVVERQWGPRAVVGAHAHEFAAKALLVSGELWLTIAADTRHLRAGDSFEIGYAQPHSERYGDEGATYWVARKGPPARAA
jgi:hypothetical protein